VENMDNFALNVRAVSRETFKKAVEIAFAATPGGKASHYVQSRRYGLVLFWMAHPGDVFEGNVIHALPDEMNATEAASFAWKWMERKTRNEFQLKGWDRFYDDGDVACEPAYRVFVEDWGHVGGSHSAVCAILPCWAWLGK
jgi:hypothetical protein